MGTREGGRKFRARLATLVAGSLLLLVGLTGQPGPTAPRHHSATLVAEPKVVLPGALAGDDPIIDQLAQHAIVRQRIDEALAEAAARARAPWAWDFSLPKDRLVLLYGSSMGLGLISSMSDGQLVRFVRDQTAAYQRADPSHPAVPGFDFVTPVAQPWPMRDGTWTARVPDAQIRHYLSLAEANQMMFFFDLQIGHSTVAREMDGIAPYLSEPGVGVALDPEFDMLSVGGAPGSRFGSMSADEINLAIDRLATLVDRYHLPPKVLIVHQFLDSMLPDRGRIHLRPEVAVVLCTDGFGPPGSKIDDYARYDNPAPQFPGFKLFYRQDHPLMSEAAVVGLRPSPVMVMYQ